MLKDKISLSRTGCFMFNTTNSNVGIEQENDERIGETHREREPVDARADLCGHTPAQRIDDGDDTRWKPLDTIGRDDYLKTSLRSEREETF